MLRIILIGLLFLGFGWFILYHLLKFGFNAPKSPEAIAAERNEILKRLEKFRNILIPFLSHEASLISTRYKTPLSGKNHSGVIFFHL